MINSGYDSQIISELYYIYERGEKADQLVNNIKCAFRGVKLNEGIGLMQAQALSDFQVEEIAYDLREHDEKVSWEKITSSKLLECRGALFFFDAKGMKFHLPAFMCSELRGDHEYRLVGILTTDFELFSEFDQQQKEVVGKFLSFLNVQPEYKDYDNQKIESAIQEFWHNSEGTGSGSKS